MPADLSPVGNPSHTVEAHIVAVAERLNTLIPDITASMRQLLVGQVLELGDPTLVALLGASIQGNMETIAHMFQYGIPVEKLEPPSGAVEFARRQAQQGIPIKALVRAYHLGHDHMLTWCFAEVDRLVDDPVQGARVAQYLVSQTFRYIDWITQQIVEVYEEERDEWLANRNALRTARIRELINGHAKDPDAADSTLGYSLRQQHVAIVLWVDPASPGAEVIGHIERFAVALAGALQCSAPPLTMAYDRRSVWGWFGMGSRTEVDIEAIRAFAQARSRPPNLAVSAAAFGYDGFRSAHEQALAVQAIALARTDAMGPRVVGYGEPGVASVSLLSKDLNATRAWVGSVLGPLAEDDENHARLRETLRIFLEENGSFTSAAERLMMHKNSVKYRISKARDALGRPIGPDRLDIELALTACQWLGPTVLKAP